MIHFTYIEPVSYTHLDVYKRQILSIEKDEDPTQSVVKALKIRDGSPLDVQMCIRDSGKVIFEYLPTLWDISPDTLEKRLSKEDYPPYISKEMCIRDRC